MITIRPFDDSDEGFELMARVFSDYFDTFPITAERARYRRELHAIEGTWQALTAAIDGRDAGVGVVMEPRWIKSPSKRYVMHGVEAGLIGSELERELLLATVEAAKACGVDAIYTEVESRREAAVSWLGEAGFALELTMVYTEVDLIKFDPAKFEPEISALEASGLRLMSMAEAMEEIPDWREQYMSLINDNARDIPSHYEFAGFTADWMDSLLNAPGFDASLRWQAYDGGLAVGGSDLNRNPVDPSRFGTGGTSVRREYRRRGLARALKAKALGSAKALGGVVVGTENEVSNPMLQLNYSLGFERKFDLLDFVWRRS
jgi:GNAT superfamily N-acetyltransferase